MSLAELVKGLYKPVQNVLRPVALGALLAYCGGNAQSEEGYMDKGKEEVNDYMKDKVGESEIESDLEHDSWEVISANGAPEGREDHTAVWTGSEMIVWGGVSENRSSYLSIYDTGGKYVPIADAWVPTPIKRVPEARYRHTVIWRESELSERSEMIVWGGETEINNDGRIRFLNTGGRYRPDPNSPFSSRWFSVSTVGVPKPRFGYSTIWTGSEMIVWGGSDCQTENGEETNCDAGARYRTGGNEWISISTNTFYKVQRSSHTAVWTGSEMIVWGGLPPVNRSTGELYDPSTDTWVPVSTTGAPEIGNFHTAVWTGSEMIVWGRQGNSNSGYGGGRYDPSTDTWASISTPGAPWRNRDTIVWTGLEMIVWGGSVNLEYSNLGQKYNPLNDSWVPISTDGAPESRAGHTAVWTGSEMIVWGGVTLDSNSNAVYLNTGGRYRP